MTEKQKKKDMTEKQKKFCIEYLKNPNATQSATKAGYSKNTAYSIGSELLRKPEIQEFLKKEVADLLNIDKITLRNRIVNELAAVAFDPMVDEDSSIRYNDKLKALELLGKYDSMFIEKVEHIVNKEAIDELRALYENK